MSFYKINENWLKIIVFNVIDFVIVKYDFVDQTFRLFRNLNNENDNQPCLVYVDFLKLAHFQLINGLFIKIDECH